MMLEAITRSVAVGKQWQDKAGLPFFSVARAWWESNTPYTEVTTHLLPGNSLQSNSLPYRGRC